MNDMAFLMNDMAFLKKLKPGDTVIVYQLHWYQTMEYVKTVEEVTPTGFIKVMGKLFDPVTGRGRGDCNRYGLIEATQERLQQHYEITYVQETLAMLKELNNLTYAQAQTIRSAINSTGMEGNNEA